mgnify:CR=1 FL=1
MPLRPRGSSTRQVIRFPNVTPKDEAQAQWSHTLPLDFAETVPMAIFFTEDESSPTEEVRTDE